MYRITALALFIIITAAGAMDWSRVCNTGTSFIARMTGNAELPAWNQRASSQFKGPFAGSWQT